MTALDAVTAPSSARADDDEESRLPRKKRRTKTKVCRMMSGSRADGAEAEDEAGEARGIPPDPRRRRRTSTIDQRRAGRAIRHALMEERTACSMRS
jgi:hypothetical protein